MPQCAAFLYQRALQRDEANTVCMSNIDRQKKPAQEENNFPCPKTSESTQLQVNIRKKRESRGFNFLYVSIFFHVWGEPVHDLDFCCVQDWATFNRGALGSWMPAVKLFSWIKTAEAVTYTESVAVPRESGGVFGDQGVVFWQHHSELQHWRLRGVERWDADSEDCGGWEGRK